MKLTDGHHSFLCVSGKASPDCPGCRIDALEAQLAQRDERIRKLREVMDGVTCTCGRGARGREHLSECPQFDIQIALAADRLLADAKEGEGK